MGHIDVKKNIKFKNLYEAFVDKAQNNRNAVYIYFQGVEENRSITYVEALQIIRNIRANLKNQGLRKGDSVGILLPNSPQFVLFFFACMSIGIFVVPLNIRQDGDNIKHCLSDSNASILLTSDYYLSLVKTIRSDLPNLKYVYCTDRDTDGEVISFSELTNEYLADTNDFKDDTVTLDDVAVVLYTSGTTAQPKGVMWSHGNCLYLGRLLTNHYKFNQNDKHVVILPIYHVNGLGFSILPVTYIGGSLILIEKYSASQYWDIVIKYNGTVVSLIAMPIKTLLLQPPSNYDRNHSVRLGFAALQLAPEEWNEFRERFNIHLIQFFGLTEGPGQKLASPLSDIRENTLGRPIGDTLVRLVDEDDADVNFGEVGEIIVKSKSAYGLMKGYLGMPEETANALRNGWLHTGDLAWQDDDGYFRYYSRKKDMIKRAGEDISPKEIEEFLMEHPAIHEAAVIGVPDELREEAVKAFILLKEGENISADIVLEYCRDNLAEYKVPQYIEIVNDFERDQVGRIQKKKLRNRQN